MKSIFTTEDVLQKILASEDWFAFVRDYAGMTEARAELDAQIDGDFALDEAVNELLAVQTAAALAFGVEVAIGRGHIDLT